MITLIALDHFFGNRNLTPLPGSTERDLGRLVRELQSEVNAVEGADPKYAAVAVADSPYTVDMTVANVIGVDCSGGAVSVVLPAAADVPVGDVLKVKDEGGDAGTNNITLTGTVDGVVNPAITENYGFKEIYSNGTAWLSLDTENTVSKYVEIAVGDSPYTPNMDVANIIGVDCSGGAVSVVLPAAATVKVGELLKIKDESGSSLTNNITLTGTVDGDVNPIIDRNFGSKVIYSNGAAWMSIDMEEAVPKHAAIVVGDSPYTVPMDDVTMVGVDCSGGAVSVVLPSPGGVIVGEVLRIKDESGDATTNNITVVGTIDGVTDPTISTDYDSVAIYSNGTAWLNL